MQRFLTSLLVMMLYLLSSNSSAQQFESFRQVGDVTGLAAGTVTSITLAAETAELSYFNVAGLSTIYDVDLTPSQIIRDRMPVFMPSADFGNTQPSMNLDAVGFFTGSLFDPNDPDGDVPAHWFRMTYYNGIWSGAFRIADRIYSIDRSRRDNIVEVRSTPSQNKTLRPVRQMKVTALIDEGFVFADSVGDSIGMDHVGHIHALESIHVMEGMMNDSLGITLSLDQLIYQSSTELISPANWLGNNATSFGIEDNYASIIFAGSQVTGIHTADSTDSGYKHASLNKLDFHQFSTAHQFGRLLGIAEEDNTLQSAQNPLHAAHWNKSQMTGLLSSLPGPPLILTISSDEPEVEITETESINLIPQSILDSEIVESGEIVESEGSGNTDSLAIGGGLLQNDGTNSNPEPMQTPAASGGGAISPLLLLHMLLLFSFSRRRATN